MRDHASVSMHGRNPGIVVVAWNLKLKRLNNSNQMIYTNSEGLPNTRPQFSVDRLEESSEKNSELITLYLWYGMSTIF